MEVVIHQREEDLESGRREWVEFSFWHKVVSIISISMNDYTPNATTSATLIWQTLVVVSKAREHRIGSTIQTEFHCFPLSVELCQSKQWCSYAVRPLIATLAALFFSHIATAPNTISLPTEDGGVIFADVYGTGDRGVVVA